MTFTRAALDRMADDLGMGILATEENVYAYGSLAAYFDLQAAEPGIDPADQFKFLIAAREVRTVQFKLAAQLEMWPEGPIHQ